MGKAWYKSKTMWVNLLVVGGAVVSGVVGLVPTLQPLVEPNTYALLMFSAGVVNLVLRAVTDTAIGIKESADVDET
jgi:hypothetical protein